MTPKLQFPASVLANHVAILGKTGSGKTSTGKLLIEQEADQGFRVCILDTVKSDWWGLVSSADGKKPGLPFQILGGPHGHVPLHSSAGKAIGELVGRGDLPLSIIDMADFEAGGLQKFFTAFAPALLKSMRGVLVLVMEEAHEIAPKERAGIGAETVAIYYAKKIATAGRSKGIRLRILSQRTQAVHNALLGSCETLIAHRISKAEDQEPVIKWIRAHSGKDLAQTVGEQLARFDTGTGYMISPDGAGRFAFPKFRTYDNSATPENDGEFEEVVKTAPVDTEKLRAILGEAVKEAEESDPARLKARIKELEGQRPGSAPSAQAISEARAGGYREGFEAGRLKGREDISFALNNVCIAVDEAAEAVGEAKGLLDKITTAPIPAVQNRIQPGGSSSTKSTVHDVRMPAAGDAVEMPAGERRVLIAIAQYREGVTREQLTILTGYKKSSRDTYINRLTSRGFVNTWQGNLIATAGGINALGKDWKRLPTGAALRDHWLQELPEGERRIFSVVLAAYPNPVSREGISGETHYKKSSRDTYIRKLMARQLIVAADDGVRASANLFTE